VSNINHNDVVIYTSWTQASDCLPKWSNRGHFGFPPIVLPNAKDECSDDDGEDDNSATITFGERQDYIEAREDIEYDQQMQEAMRRSLEDHG